MNRSRRLRGFVVQGLLYVGGSIVFAFALAGCQKGHESTPDLSSGVLESWEGKNVTVQFRRDALGAAASLPIGPETNSINGAQTSVSGVLVQVDTESVTLESNARQRWIPKSVVLNIEGPRP